MEQLTFLSGEPPAKASRSRGSEKALKIPEEILHLPTVQFLINLSPSGLSGKTSLASCLPTEDGTLVPSSGRWQNSGMGSHTECVTLSGLESPSDVVVSSLSDVLETGEVPQRFFLSPKACAGILRRAEKRGKKLPPQLYKALHTVAQEMSE